MGSLTVRLSDGTQIVVPSSLNAITTYVLLEQEAWFEKEWTFFARWLKPGMHVIDIGANVGVYALPAARAVGPEGRVYAYEPGSQARGFLEQSCECNGLHNLTVIADAISDRARQGRLGFRFSSELHSLRDDSEGEGEEVRITSLDEEDRIRNWGPLDFVKIDAEGEEGRILEGGRQFFARHSPLVMFEVKSGHSAVAEGSVEFRAQGYGVFRLVPGGPLLVPSAPDVPIDSYELNLFAAKPDRAAALMSDQWLIETVPSWAPNDAARTAGLDLLRAQAFGPALAPLCQRQIDRSYRDSLAAYAAWRSEHVSLPLRYAALTFAYRELRKLCRSVPAAGRLSTLARVAWELGERGACVEALKTLFQLGLGGMESLNEPCWPANPRFDAVDPGPDVGGWSSVAAIEQAERTFYFSSYFADKDLSLDSLCRQPFASLEMERRRVLKARRAGKSVTVPARLREASDGHINADLWRDAVVPLS